METSSRKSQKWSPEREEQLRLDWAAGFTASQIAFRMEGKVSRCAVIGKAHRMGLAGRPHSGRPPKPRKRRTTPRKRSPKTRLTLAAPIAPVFVPPEERISLVALKADTCRFPFEDVGHASFGFCGKSPHNGSPYCLSHLQTCWRHG